MLSEMAFKQQLPHPAGAAPNERRQRQRFNIRLAVDVTGATPTHHLIAGWSVDISPMGVRITSDALTRYQPRQRGATVIVSAAWPVLRNGVTRLRLIMVGEIVWSTSCDMAVRILRHYFEPHGV
jgi:hypothetical protein